MKHWVNSRFRERHENDEKDEKKSVLIFNF